MTQLAVPLSFDQIYDELRRLAKAYLRNERRNHTLQPTALVNEAYLRLEGIDRSTISDRDHFMVLAARAMRRVLVDHARQRNALKRKAQLVTLQSEALGITDTSIDVAALDRALTELAAADQKRARIAELHFFCGLSAKEAGKVVGIAERTAYLHLRSAKAWIMAAFDASHA